MSSLIASPYLLVQGSAIKVKARAANVRGWSAYSPVNSSGQTAETVPRKMATPVEGSGTSTTQIVVQYQASIGLATGGNSLPILSYHVQRFNAVAAAWADVQGLPPSDSTDLSFTTTDVVGGESYRFRVRAYNVYGPGEYSDEVVIEASAAPDQVTGVATSVVDTDVLISWTAPSFNYKTISQYDILILDNDGTWRNDMTYCNGSVSSVVSSASCRIPMSILRASPFSLPFRAAVTAKVRAMNEDGYGEYSSSGSGATIETAPSKMTAISRDSSTSQTLLVIDWNALVSPDNGDAEILLYQAQYKLSTGLFAEGVNAFNVTGTSFSVSDGVTAGASYTFRVRAANKFGFGPYSDELIVKAAAAPGQPAAPTATIIATSSTTGGVRIVWAQPDARSQPIDQYQVTIATAAGTFVESSTCDGSSSTVVSTRVCVVQSSELTGSTFGLQFRDTIRIKVSAHNTYGWGVASAESSSLTLQRVPSQVVNVRSGAGTSKSQVQVSWDALTFGEATGDASILSYNLQLQLSDGTWSSLVGESSDSLATSYTVTTGIVAGTSYTFRVRARNIQGWGAPSSTVAILAAQAPPQMASVVTTIVNTDVKIQWTAPSNYGSAITAYEIVFSDKTGTFKTQSS